MRHYLLLICSSVRHSVTLLGAGWETLQWCTEIKTKSFQKSKIRKIMYTPVNPSFTDTFVYFSIVFAVFISCEKLDQRNVHPLIPNNLSPPTLLLLLLLPLPLLLQGFYYLQRKYNFYSVLATSKLNTTCNNRAFLKGFVFSKYR